MDCYKFEEKITKFLDNELKQDIRQVFLDHKDTCSKCDQKFNEIKKYTLLFNQLNHLKTSSNFLKKLDNKIYNYNNNLNLMDKIKRLSMFTYRPQYLAGYAMVLLIFSYSLFSILSIDQTNYNKLNEKITAQLSNNDVDGFNKVDDSYSLDDVQLAENDNDLTHLNKDKKNVTINNNRNYQTIRPVSSRPMNSNISSIKQADTKIASHNRSNKSIKKNKYLVDYDNKNKYFKKRKDSLINALNNVSDIKAIMQIKERIRIDSLEQLQYFQKFEHR